MWAPPTGRHLTEEKNTIMRTALRTMAATTATAALTLTLAASLATTATAAGIGVTDPNDTSHGSDLRSVQVKHGRDNVKVITTHENLRRDPASGSGGVVYLDTDPDDDGPEFALVGGYFVGTDYQLVATEGFGQKKWGQPVEFGDYRMTINYAKEHVRTQISRAAIGDPDEVRVAIRVSGTRTDGTSHGLVDWLGESRSFTEWVARG
ncbi:MAG: hypothetical protein WB767_01825 [Nocardioides sp.]